MRKLVKFDTSTTDTTNPKLVYTSFASVLDKGTGKETNVELLSAEDISREAINRDLGFQDIIMKNSIYEAGTSPNKIASEKLSSNTEKTKIIKLFKDTFLNSLKRGYTQGQSKKIAKAEVDKYIDEEFNYYIKKFSI